MERPILILVLLFLSGLVVTVIGAMFRILHWPGGKHLILLGMLLQALGVGMLIWKLISGRNSKKLR